MIKYLKYLMACCRFPESGDLCRNWIAATGRTNWTPKPYSKICSRHFEEKVLNKKKKLTLLFPNAVPTLVNIQLILYLVQSPDISCAFNDLYL